MHARNRTSSPRVRRLPVAAALAGALLAALGALSAAPAATPPDRPLQTLVRRPEAVAPWEAKHRPFTPVIIDVAGPAGQNGTVAVPNIQSETSVAASGLLVVAGYNDFRFMNNSVSGVIRSTDGGATFVDGGDLPTAGAGDFVYGDPVLAVYNPPVGPPVFYYTSIYLNALGLQTMCLHRSTDGGATWAGPFEVSSATIATDSADKEWLTVDPQTGRVFMSWSSFGAQVTIYVTYSDNAATGSPPTWSPAISLGTSGQGSCVAADPGGLNAYVAWRRSTSVAFSRSTDNGATWTAGVNLTPTFSTVVPPYGFDRYNSFPSITVNPVGGVVELVYAASVNGTPSADFGNIFHRRSTDGGVTFSAPVMLNVEVGAGAGRPQVFPSVACASDGRIDVFWYDESSGSGTSDLSDQFYTFSTDFGTTWSSPVPVTPEPFHNEVGNNFSAPHQGDYVDAATDGTAGYGAFAWMDRPDPIGPQADVMVPKITSPAAVAALRVRPGTVGIVDFGCSADDGQLVAGEYGDLTIPLENFGRTSLTGITGTLTALSPGVTIVIGNGTYPTLASGASASSASPYRVLLAPTYPCGQDARFRLTIAATGTVGTFVEFGIPTGVVASTATLLSENFDGVSAPNLPAGWTAINQCTTCPPNNWVTTVLTPASPPNAAFALDNAAATTFGRLQGPVLGVPATATYLEVTFDVMTDLEQQDARYGWDALSFDYQLDGVGGSHFATADATEFDFRYTHYVDRASGDQSGDRSGWSGNTVGYKAVRVRIPGLAGHTFTPRFDLTTDSNTGNTGAWVDNVVIKSLEMGCGACAPTAVATARLSTQSTADGVDLTWQGADLDPITGWILYRSTTLAGPWLRLTADPIPAGASGTFSYHDTPPATSSLVYYRLAGVTTDGFEQVMDTIAAEINGVPAAFAASLAGPSPFRSRTLIAYSLPQRAPVRIEVFDPSGRKVRTLVEEVKDAGRYTAPFDLRAAGARPLGAGVYVIRVSAGPEERSLRVVAF